MVVSVGQAKACEGSDLGKRPRSPSPTDSATDIKISKIAKPHLSQDQLLIQMQNMYDAASYPCMEQKQQLAISDLRQISVTYQKNGSIKHQTGWTSDKPFEEGGEKKIRPFVSTTGKTRVILEQRKGSLKMQPKMPDGVALTPYWCYSQPIHPNGEGLFHKGDPSLNRPLYKNLIMKHASEGDLWYFMRREDSSKLESTSPNLGLQFLEKLDLLHRSDWAHKDIKPANLLVHKEADELKLFITDFGQSCDDLKDSGVAGTPGYRAPEVDEAFNFFSIEEVDGHRFKFKNDGSRKTLSYNPKLADLYSIGLTLFELMTGGAFSLEISYWCYEKLNDNEKNQVFNKEEFKSFRKSKVESFLNDYISQAAEGSLIKVPEFAEVIKGLIQEEPEDRLSLENAIARWKVGLDRIKSANN
jgi:hypothetical protein